MRDQDIILLIIGVIGLILLCIGIVVYSSWPVVCIVIGGLLCAFALVALNN